MIVESVRAFLGERGIGPCGIVAAVSGGSDSVALLLALEELRHDGYEITCGHINHHLRGAEADADEAFVRSLCAERAIPFVAADGTVERELVRLHGIEGAAREIRTERLQGIRRARNARFIATGHQKNDQAETVLMRLTSGSGVAGLRGIHPQRDDGFIRPLLQVTRCAIEAFLAARGIEPRHDAMNDDPRYLRNRVRESLRSLGPTAVDHFAMLAAEAQEQWVALEQVLDAVEGVTTTAADTRFSSLPDDPWLRRALLLRHIRRLSRKSRDVSAADLARLADEADRSTRVTVTADVELIRRGGVVLLRRIPQRTKPFEFDVANDRPLTIASAGVSLVLRRAATDDTAFAARTRQPFQLPSRAPADFTVRSRRPGDRFHPLGLSSPKKLKDFLIDRKIAVEERDRIPLLLWRDEIVWVAGVEVADPFKITAAQCDTYVAEIEPLA